MNSFTIWFLFHSRVFTMNKSKFECQVFLISFSRTAHQPVLCKNKYTMEINEKCYIILGKYSNEIAPTRSVVSLRYSSEFESLFYNLRTREGDFLFKSTFYRWLMEDRWKSVCELSRCRASAPPAVWSNGLRPQASLSLTQVRELINK